jgi:hypothetical protein
MTSAGFGECVLVFGVIESQRGLTAIRPHSVRGIVLLSNAGSRNAPLMVLITYKHSVYLNIWAASATVQLRNLVRSVLTCNVIKISASICLFTMFAYFPNERARERERKSGRT